MYDPDTQYYHKTICFAYPIQEVEKVKADTENNEEVINNGQNN